jgi:hypothetical protein
MLAFKLLFFYSFYSIEAASEMTEPSLLIEKLLFESVCDFDST